MLVGCLVGRQGCFVGQTTVLAAVLSGPRQEMVASLAEDSSDRIASMGIKITATDQLLDSLVSTARPPPL